jgi:hypothetical protein
MRVLAVVLAVVLALDAAAQEPPPPPMPPPDATATIPSPPLVVAPLPLRITPPPEEVSRWRSARIASVVGSLVSLVGSGLSVAAVIYVAVTPAGINPPSPSDPGTALAYAGSTTSAAGFVISATALGVEHRILDRLGVDPGRGPFAVGTTIGILGFTTVGTSYLFGLTHIFEPNNQQVAVLVTTIGGAALCGIAGLFYAIDSSRNKKAWTRLGTF